MTGPDPGVNPPAPQPQQPLIAVVAALDQLTGPRRPSEVGSPFPQYERSPGHFSDADHHDHLHIGVG